MRTASILAALGATGDMNVGSQNTTIKVRSLQTMQGDVSVYLFFMPSAELHKIADIARMERGAKGKLEGFQRKIGNSARG